MSDVVRGAAATGFRYRAARSDGAIESGHLDATSAEQAMSLLASRGLFPIAVRAEGRARTERPTLPLADLALGLRVMANLLDAGLPMTRTLRAFEELAPAAWGPVLPHLRQSVKEGSGLAGALATAPVQIPPLVIGITRAGEAGQGIAAAVRRGAEVIETAAATRAAIRGALVYPAILAAAGAASIGMLVGIVIPRFAGLLAEVGQSLPPATRAVMAIADLTRAAFVPAAIAIVVFALGWRAWTSTDAGREWLHEGLLALPLVGEIRRAAATARASWALSALLGSGVPIAEALRFAAQSAGDAAIERRLLRARAQVVTGTAIGRAIEETNAMTSTAIRLVRAGEESGRLPELVAHAAKLEQERSERIVRSAVRALEPALILVFALVVALVAAALLQAVYSVRPA